MWVRHKGRNIDTGWPAEREAREARRRAEVAKIMEKWVTVWRLKEERNWTDGAIKKHLGEPTEQNGYKVFLVADVLKAEARPEFLEWMHARIEKQYQRNLGKYSEEWAAELRQEALARLEGE